MSVNRARIHDAQLTLLPLVAARVNVLTDSTERILEFRDARDWKQFHRPKELAAALAIEAAEVQEIFLWRDAESSEAFLSSNKDRFDKLRHELADVAIYLLLLAHELNVDLADAIAQKVDANERRFPIAETRGSAGKFNVSSEPL